MTSLFKRTKAKFFRIKYLIRQFFIKIGLIYEWNYSYELGAYRTKPTPIKKESKKPKKPKKIKIKKPKKKRLQKYKIKYRNFKKDHAEKIAEWKGLFILVVSYGIVLNYIAYIILSWKFGWYTFWAYGLLYYLFKEEVPRIIQQSRAK
jgi:hypothetical protein